MQLKPIHRYDLNGDFVDETDMRWKEAERLWEKYGKRTMLLGWHEIRQLLFDYLPPGTVDFDKQVCCPSRLTITCPLPTSALRIGPQLGTWAALHDSPKAVGPCDIQSLNELCCNDRANSFQVSSAAFGRQV